MTVWEMFKTTHQQHFQYTNLIKTCYYDRVLHVSVEHHAKNWLITSSVSLQSFKAVEVIFVLLLAKNHRKNILKRTIWLRSILSVIAN